MEKSGREWGKVGYSEKNFMLFYIEKEVIQKLVRNLLEAK